MALITDYKIKAAMSGVLSKHLEGACIGIERHGDEIRLIAFNPNTKELVFEGDLFPLRDKARALFRGVPANQFIRLESN